MSALNGVYEEDAFLKVLLARISSREGAIGEACAVHDGRIA